MNKDDFDWLLEKHPSLNSHFESLHVPPLRKRKRDLSLIVESLIARFNQQTGKSIQGIEREAYDRLMAYDWPGDLEELEMVIRRAVHLAQGDQLTSEDVFIGRVPVSGTWSLNLLRLAVIRGLFRHRAYPLAFQVVAAFFFGFILYEGFWGPQRALSNMSLPLTWGIWEPMIILSAFFAARVWCAVCPIGAMSEFLSRHFSLQMRVPHFIRRYGFWLCAAGLGLIMWSEVSFSLFSSPSGTALLILTIAVLGALFGILLQRRSWCRYICPLGHVIGVFAHCSMVEVRSSSGTCTDDCPDQRCFGDDTHDHGCPVFRAPFSLASNLECILCGKCLKSCPHESPRLNLRIPGYELTQVQNPSPVVSTLIPVILATQLFRALDAQGLFRLMHDMPYGWFALAALLIAMCLGAFGFVRVSGWWSFDTLQSRDALKHELFSYALIPLAFAYELAYQLNAVLTKSGSLIPAIGEKFGWNWGRCDFTLSQGGFMGWQSLLILGGLLAATIVLKNLARMHEHDSHGDGWQRSLPLLIITGVCVWSCFIAA
jgi:polyferredoxin